MSAPRHIPPRDDVPDSIECARRGINSNPPGAPTYGDARRAAAAPKLRVIELFSCAGGMAEGLRRANLPVTEAFDWDDDACESYAANHGHKPIQADANDLLRMVRAGWRPAGAIDLFVADPPCTPWSRAGKRKGTEDKRDCLETTVELVRWLRPECALIANVPGLDDAPNWPVVQRTLGGLSDRYEIDFARLDAADYGVPQHRIRPFWFLRPHGSRPLTWPTRTHGPPGDRNAHLFDALLPWVTCRQALGHLSPKELGSPIRLRWRGCKGDQVASVPDRPARGVGTSNLSDGNVLASPDVATRKRVRTPGRKPLASAVDEPAHVVTAREGQGDGSILMFADDHPPCRNDSPSPTVRGGGSGHSAPPLYYVTHPAGPNGCLDGYDHRPSALDEPSKTLTSNTHSDGALLSVVDEPSHTNEPSHTIRSAPRGTQTIAVVPHHPPSEIDEPSRTVRASSATTPDKVLHGNAKHPPADLDAPAPTVGAKDRGGQGAQAMPWPWDSASTVVTADPNGRIGPPGHHGKSFLSSPNAVKLSEKAAAILQGFSENWVFAGKTKRSRWSQIGMAMPPPLAEAVARSIRRWFDRASADGKATT